MSIITVNSNQLIGVAKYNEIQNTASIVLSYYGVIPESVPLSVGTTGVISTSSSWGSLWTDINRCTIHQTGASIPGSARPTTSTVASVILTNQIIDAANLAFTNRNVAAIGQLTEFTSPSIRTSNFGNTGAIRHTVEYEWVDADAMTSFLQTGGRLEADLAWSNTGIALDSDLIDVLGLADDDLQTNTYQVSVTNQTPANVSYSKGVHTVTVTFTRTTTKKYTIDISILSTTVQTLGGSSITGVTRCFTSTDDGPAPGGIAGPVPAVEITTTFEGSAVPPTATRSLSASPATLSYSFFTGDSQSTAQTVTLTNNGNSLLQITGISYTTTGGVVARPTYSWTGNSTFANTTINSGASRTISLAYSGATAGTFNNSIRITNDGNQPLLTIPATQVVAGFGLNPIPASLTPTVTSLSLYTQQFVITNSNISPIRSSSYTSSATGTGFYTINSDAGPTLVFDPSGRSNGSYSGTISVTIGGFTLSRTVTIALDVPTQTLGSWLSPLATDNAVVGMSYDVIGGTRYLTIGVGMGNDGANFLSSGGGNFASVANLNYAADPDPSKGVPLYDYDRGSGSWVDFLKGHTETGGVGYGVVYAFQDYNNRIHTTMPVTNILIKRSYTFNARSGVHTFDYAVDDNGYVEISNPNSGGFDVVFDGRGRGRANFQNVNSGSWSAPVTGVYTINLYSQNTGGPGAFAFRLDRQDTQEAVWNTRVPVRTAYRYWGEVYRIPLNQGAHTYRTGELDTVSNLPKYLVKDSVMTETDGKPYGAFFEGQSMFTVRDDGTGNLTITINPVGSTLPSSAADKRTIYNITALPFYYSAHKRYSNLSNGSLPAGRTYRFDGFTNQGGVITSEQSYPSDPTLAIPPDPPPYDYSGYGA
jgi:hypothetical protein